MGALAIPELRHRGFAALFDDKGAGGSDLLIARVVVEETGLQIGDDAHARCMKLAEQRFRVRILVAIPGEDVPTSSE